MGAITATVVILGFLSWTIRIPYDTVAPGSARVVNGLVKVSDHPVYPARGKVLFTTVSVRERVNLVEAVAGWLDPDVDVISERKVRGTIPPDQYKKLNIEAMNDSKTTAEVVALRHLGYNDLGDGAEIVAVEPGLPAAHVLKVGDVIVAVDGQPTKSSPDLVGAIQAHKPGDTITLAVVRDGRPVTDESVELARGDQGQALLGVRSRTKVALPFPITIDSGTVEGPSAGLPYALELLDYLTPGELTGGTSVAATGELRPDGQVKPVGGMAQKTEAVQRSKASLFLVPPENFAEAAAHAGDGLQVRAVNSFDEALRALSTLPASNAPIPAEPEGTPTR